MMRYLFLLLLLSGCSMGECTRNGEHDPMACFEDD
jgi:hypothetical protein